MSKINKRSTALALMLAGGFFMGTQLNAQSNTETLVPLEEAKVEVKETVPFLGVSTHYASNGVKISKITANSSAEASGLQAGDIITAVNNQSIHGHHDLRRIVRAQKVGDEIVVAYTRDNNANTIVVKLGGKELNNNERTYTYSYNYEHNYTSEKDACEELEKLTNTPILGVYIDMNKHNLDKALVSRVIDNTGAARINMTSADQIFKIDGNRIQNYDDLAAFVKTKEVGDKIDIIYFRENKRKRATATLGSIGETQPYQVIKYEKQCPDEEVATPADEPVSKIENVVIDEPTTPAEDASPIVEGSNNEASDLAMAAAMLETFPNPTTDLVNIAFDGEVNIPVTIRIVTLDGKEIYRNELEDFSGSYLDQVDLKEYASGVYFVNIEQGETKLSKQVIKE
ncbi:MAG: PDZ domain-containing protein [Saprospiraceae bacterium]|nr:PDZ domain-containing protein [Saprospiraceae bacterium]